MKIFRYTNVIIFGILALGRMRPSYLKVLLLLLLPILIYFHLHGIVIVDEGHILLSSEKILSGMLPYRDFDFDYTPLSIFLTAFSFKALGASVLSSRILMIGLSLLSSLLIFKIVHYSTKNRLYSTLATLLFVSWGPPHINFSSPIIFALTISLLTIILLQNFLNTRSKKYLFYAGIAAFGVFSANQNLGLAILPSVIIFFMIKNSRRLEYILIFFYGYCWSLIAFIFYLLFTDSFAPFIYNFNYYSSRWISTDGFPFHLFNNYYGGNYLIAIIYLFPFIFPIASFLLLFYRRRFHLLFLQIYLISLYIFWKTLSSDYRYLALLISLLGISIGLLIRYTVTSYFRISLYLLFIGLITAGFYTSIIYNYFDSKKPITKISTYSTNPKIRVFIGKDEDEQLNNLTKIVSTHTSFNEYIFADSIFPLLYFISDRKDPVRKIYSPKKDTKSFYHEVVGNLVAKNVKLVIISHSRILDKSFRDFLVKNYILKDKLQDFDIYEKRL